MAINLTGIEWKDKKFCFLSMNTAIPIMTIWNGMAEK